MANFPVTLQVGQAVTVTCNGVPTPNTGLTILYASSSSSNAAVADIRNALASSFWVRAFAPGTATITVVTQNASAMQFTDTITVTVPNPIPDATGSGLQISAPFTA